MPASNPGQSFQIVNGQVTQRDKLIEARSDDGIQYEALPTEPEVELSHFFDSTRFPFADELLSIQVEDPTAFAGGRARYVADEVSERGELPCVQLPPAAGHRGSRS